MAKKPKLTVPKGAGDDYSESEAAKRRDAILKRMLETPPQPRQPKTTKLQKNGGGRQKGAARRKS